MKVRLVARRLAALVAALSLAAGLLHGASMQFAAATPSGAAANARHMTAQAPAQADPSAHIEANDCPHAQHEPHDPGGATANCPLGTISAVQPPAFAAFGRSFQRKAFAMAGQRALAAADIGRPDPPPRF